MCCTFHPPRRKSSPLIIDLRSKTAFNTRHLPGSFHLPLDGLTPKLAGGDLFGDPHAVFSVWNGIQSLFYAPPASKILEGAKIYHLPVLVVCYDGDASRLATSTLRHRGVEASSVKGGFEALCSVMERIKVKS